MTIELFEIPEMRHLTREDMRHAIASMRH